MRMALNLDEDIGPGLLFDRASLDRWRQTDWRAIHGPEAFSQEAAAGWCSYIYSLNLDAGLGGRIELYVDEPPPEAVSHAVMSATGLWLRTPTGRLILQGAGSITPQGTATPSVLEFEVPSGDCSVDLYAFKEHLQRLQEEGTPGAPPRTRWTRFLDSAGCLFGVMTVLLAMFFLASILKGHGSSVKWILVAMIAPWCVWTLARELTGEGRRARERHRRLNDILARLPPIPDIMVVVRTGFQPGPTARGGGVGWDALSDGASGKHS